MDNDELSSRIRALHKLVCDLNDDLLSIGGGYTIEDIQNDKIRSILYSAYSSACLRFSSTLDLLNALNLE